MFQRLEFNSQFRLAAVFGLLVLLPSLLLGWFCLRAVDSERRAREVRLLQDYHRYAEFASRTVQQELAELEIAWQDLVPVLDPAGGVTPRIDSASLANRYVEAAYLFAMDGRLLRAEPRTGTEVQSAAAFPSSEEARLFAERSIRGEDAEFELGDARAAMVEYADIADRITNPRLRAIATANLARAALQARDWNAALAAARRVLEMRPAPVDFENQPLHLVARLAEARALESKGDPDGAAAALLALDTELADTGHEISLAQYEYFRGRLSEAFDRVQPKVDANRGRDFVGHRSANATRQKPAADDAFLARKLERKLLRAAMDEEAGSPRWRYLSDVAEGKPYLLAYVLLPGAPGGTTAGLFGLVIDLPRVSKAVLPAFLRELELSETARLEIVDEAGRHVIGEAPSGSDAAGTPVATSELAEPFEFWSIAVHARAPGAAQRATDFRTRVYLYLIAMLLLAIAAGAVIVAIGLRREARIANLKTSFVSNVSHELRTPLTSIRMYAEMLDSVGEKFSEAERRRQLGVIRSESGRLERLIDAVLDFASLQRGTKKFEFEFEEVGELVRSVAEEFRDQAEAIGFRYSVEVEPDLPEVRLDADAMRQVLLNLLSNAVKYSEDDRWIAVRAFRREAEVGLQVEDHGIGIEPSEQQRIFEDFYRVDQRLSSTRQGVGLGLTLVRRIVEAHRGRVTVESVPSGGSRFTVWLPIEPAERQAVTPPDGRVPQEA